MGRDQILTGISRYYHLIKKPLPRLSTQVWTSAVTRKYAISLTLRQPLFPEKQLLVRTESKTESATEPFLM